MKTQEKLLKVQSSLKAPKGQYNSFGNYNYRSCEDILEAVKPLLLREGLTMTITDEIVLVGDRFYLKANVVVSCDDVNSISVCAFAREAQTKKGMDESQITGSASSYARKYALNGMFLIDDTKDAETRNNATEEKDEHIDDKQKSQIIDLVASKEIDLGKFLKYMGISKIEDMPKSKFGVALSAIENKKKKEA